MISGSFLPELKRNVKMNTMKPSHYTSAHITRYFTVCVLSARSIILLHTDLNHRCQKATYKARGDSPSVSRQVPAPHSGRRNNNNNKKIPAHLAQHQHSQQNLPGAESKQACGSEVTPDQFLILKTYCVQIIRGYAAGSNRKIESFIHECWREPTPWPCARRHPGLPSHAEFHCRDCCLTRCRPGRLQINGAVLKPRNAKLLTRDRTVPTVPACCWNLYPDWSGGVERRPPIIRAGYEWIHLFLERYRFHSYSFKNKLRTYVTAGGEVS